jgi:hypothetical protein
MTDQRDADLADTDRALEHIADRQEPNDRPASPVYSHVWLDHLRTKEAK